MSIVSTYLSPEAQEQIRGFIAQAEGNEVFLVGHTNEEKVVTNVQLYARGNAFSAPALLQVAEQGDAVIHNHPSGVLQPSTADTSVASILGNDGVAFYIVNNTVTNLYAMIEPFRERVVVPIKIEPMFQLFAPDGPMARKLENFEERPPQLQMLKAVSEAVNDDQIAIIEAGTGTGKTLAYLLPSIVYAVNNKERIVVSTNTINLQEQLVNKDIPFLQSVLKQGFNAALVKGRSNYLCRRKLEEARIEPDLFSEGEDVSELRSILEWARTTKDGSKSDLNFIPRQEVWEKIQSESDTSLKTKCPHYQECFFYSARRQAAKANILVANHHLLFSDLAVRAAVGDSENAILPTYQRVVLDEAHNIEEVATSYFGMRVTQGGLLRMLGKLYRKDKKNEKGLLPYLSFRLSRLSKEIPDQLYLEIQNKIEEVGIAGIEKLRLTVTTAMDQIFDLLYKPDSYEGGNETKVRITERVFAHEKWKNEVIAPAQRLVNEIRAYLTRVERVLEKIEDLKHRLGPAGMSLTVDLRAQLTRLSEAAASIEQILLEFDDTHVRWVEVRMAMRETRIVRLLSSPLEVAPLLKETVFERFKSIILTSATLAVEGRFEYLKQRLGLNKIAEERLIEKQLEAPFDYKKQALVAIPTDISDPNHPQFHEAISELIFESIRISRGRAFVLFTSYGLLNKVYFSLMHRITALGYNVYKQGSENRHHLLERFKKDVSSVLFATDSFWEGVDVHGDALSSVIITKLPFKVPSDPVIEARVEAIEKRGGNAFYEYTLPQAAIKFKQGFGRLIRRHSDTGSVLILDKRVVTKQYGRIFLNSLPDCSVTVGTKSEVLQHLQTFYDR